MDIMNKLISMNGDYKVVIMYNRFGDNIILLLPYSYKYENFYEEDVEATFNSVFETSYGIQQIYTKMSKDHPFMGYYTTCIEDGIRSMNEKLAKYYDAEDEKYTDAFYEEIGIFDKILQICKWYNNDKINEYDLEFYKEGDYEKWLSSLKR